ncbi:MAG: DUF1571 domain-containing protein [Candidatus Auribacterota bacterium]
MKSIRIIILLALAVLFTFTHNATVSASEVDPFPILQEAKEKFDQLNDYTAYFIKQQKIGDKIHDREMMFMKFKKPFCIYYKWEIGEKGKEVIFVEGKNNNKLIGHPGGAIGLFPVSKWLSPNDPLAMKGNKHPITRSGIGNMLGSLIEVFELARANNDLQTYYMGVEALDGRPTHVVVRRLPKKDIYPSYLTFIYFDLETKLPIRVVSFDWDYKLIDFYYYKDLKVNQSLTDNDFNPGNSEYRFGLLKF